MIDKQRDQIRARDRELSQKTAEIENVNWYLYLYTIQLCVHEQKNCFIKLFVLSIKYRQLDRNLIYAISKIVGR